MPLKNEAYLRQVARSRGVPFFWLEEACQEMRIALWRAGEDPEGVSSLGKVVVKRQAIDFMRGMIGKRGQFPEPLPFCRLQAEARGTNPDTFLDDPFDFEAPQADLETIVDGEGVLSQLPLRWREVLLLYAYGFTWLAIGRRYGISESRACQLGKQAVKRLQEISE